MKGLVNPYKPGELPSTKDRFFGRDGIISWVEQQLVSRRRILILHGLPLIGKTTLAAYMPQKLALDVTVISISFNELQDYKTPTALVYTVQEITRQLSEQNAIVPEDISTATDAITALDYVIGQYHTNLRGKPLLLVIDEFDRIHNHPEFDLIGFMDVIQLLLSRHDVFNLALFINTLSLPHLRNPLIDSAPTRQISTLDQHNALKMINEPLEKIIRFDYGVPQKIAAMNSNHPHYLTVFLHVLFSNYAREGWVNLRHLDNVLNETLSQDIPSFNEAWQQASQLERAALMSMASVRGTHGIFTKQEILSTLTRQDKKTDEALIIEALESLTRRGVLVKMGALSYKFYVDLFRLWLQKHYDLEAIIKEIDWRKTTSTTPAPAEPPPAPAESPVNFPPEPAKPLLNKWIMGLGILLVLGLLLVGSLLIFDFLAPGDTGGNNTPLSQAAPTGEAVTFSTPVPNTPEPSPTPLASETPTPTAPLVVAKSLPSIAFMARANDDAPWQLYLSDQDGEIVGPLTDSGEEEVSPVWAAGGQQFAFVSRRNGDRDIYIIDADGENLRQVTTNPADDWTPAWSPDGQRLAFSSNRSGNWQIYTINADGQNLTPLTTNEDNGSISPVWSPNGERLAFTRRIDDNWELMTMAIDGSDVRRLTNNSANDLAPIWSPDGTKIAYETNLDGNVEIFLINASGGTPENLTNFPSANDHGPIFSPDGSQILFYANREGNWDIFRLDVETGAVTNLSNTPNIDEQTPVWRP